MKLVKLLRDIGLFNYKTCQIFTFLFKSENVKKWNYKRRSKILVLNKKEKPVQRLL